MLGTLLYVIYDSKGETVFTSLYYDECVKVMAILNRRDEIKKYTEDHIKWSNGIDNKKHVTFEN